MKLHPVLIKSHIRTMMIQSIYQQLLHLTVTRNGQKLAYSKGFPPFRGKFEGLELLKYAMHHHGSYMISYQHTMNFQSVRLDF